MVTSQRVIAPVERFLNDLYDRYSILGEGAVAEYIPELSKADPGWFGISIVMLDGHEYSVGDSEVPFTIQSISKPFVYGLALEDNGEEYVIERVGLEPTGDAFNAISLDPETGRPANAMINAGAIATSGMVRADGGAPLERLLNMFSRYAGRQVSVDEAVYRSESETGHRNRAIGHLLRNFGIVFSDPEEALDLYFNQCSISVTCRDLAVMAACLANQGVNPVTGARAVDARYVSSVLSVMGSCGMYDYAGEWIYRVGMPAKSGVSGGVLAVLPGQLGIGVFSPALDVRGNSVRGVGVCTDFSESYNLHLFNVPHTSDSGVRHTYDAGSVRSRRRRQPAAAEMLALEGRRVRVYELQGDQVFAMTEAFSRDVVRDSEIFDFLIIDLRRVVRIDAGASDLLRTLLSDLAEVGKIVSVSGVTTLPQLTKQLPDEISVLPTLDDALEWCEDQVLARFLPMAASDEEFVPPRENELCEGLTAAEMTAVERVLRPLTAPSGERILSAGDPGESLYLLCKGRVSVVIDQPAAAETRVATLCPGMVFGEMAMLGEPVRAASVRADSDVECRELTMDDLNALARVHSNLRAVIYENLARKLTVALRNANRELSALAG